MELVIRYGLGGKGRPFRAGDTVPEEWGRALRALRETRGEPAAVSSTHSLLVIDRAELARLLKKR